MRERLGRADWETLGASGSPSWYLDPLVAAQKREVHAELVRRWTADAPRDRILKTDLFEEAFGDDHLVEALGELTTGLYGIDVAHTTVRTAAGRWSSLVPRVVVMDVRALAWAAESFDVIVSTSTLDHFAGREEFVRALRELSRVLRPGGMLVLTLDNARNPLYHLLRWVSRLRQVPFELGYVPGPRLLLGDLRAAGLVPRRREWLIHNPRGVSTVLFLAVRRIFGPRTADATVRRLLWAFDQLGRLPTRSLSGCFVAVAAGKPDRTRLR